MGDSFGRYAKTIIQDRALPDVRDGLKPVQRRTVILSNGIRAIVAENHKENPLRPKLLLEQNGQVLDLIMPVWKNITIVGVEMDFENISEDIAVVLMTAIISSLCKSVRIERLFSSYLVRFNSD